MTAPHLTQDPSRASAAPTAPGPEAVLGVPPRTAVTVTAVVVTHGRTPFLQATLAALGAQDRAPDDVVVVDTDAARSTGDHDGLRMGDHRYVPAPSARSLGDAVDRAVTAEAEEGDPDGEPGGWIWILHDDSAPAPDALGRLLRAVEHSAAVAVAGCKQRRWTLEADGRPAAPDPARPGLLVEVGYTVSPLGRRMTGIDESEIDQGQHDAREDVLAVGLAGALVRRRVWTELGGTDPEAGVFGDSLDLCRRARLAGHRVVVVPDAVVHHAQASLRGLRRPRTHRARGTASSAYARRRSQLYARLVSVPLPLLPLALVAMVVWAPFVAGYRLALKSPAGARDEILAPLVTVLRVVPLVRGRRRAARTRSLPRRVLRPLRADWRQVAAERRDARLTRAETLRARRQLTDLERAELRRLAARRRVGLTCVLLVSVAVAVAAFAPWQGVLADGGRIVGGALLPAPAGLAETFDAATSGWVRDGLGTAAPADPWLAVVTLLTVLAGGSAQLAVNLLVVAALPLAALAGWFGAGAVTRSVWARAAAALCWAAAPTFLDSLGTGRLAAVVAHLTLPWVLLAGVRAVGVQARDDVGPAPERRGSLGAGAAAALLLAVAVGAAPVLLPVALVVMVAGIVLRPRYWRRLSLVVVPAAVVGLPFWWQAVSTWSDGGWRLLLAEPGAARAATTPDGLSLLLGFPLHRDLPTVPGDPLEVLVAIVPWLLGAGVLGLALVALFGGERVVAARVAVGAAAVGLLAALLAAGTVVAAGTPADGAAVPVHGWPSVGLSVLLLGLGVAALGVTAAPGGRPLRRAAVGLLAAAALVVPTAGLAAWWVDDVDDGSVDQLVAATAGTVPAVGQQVQAPPRSARVLQLEPVDGAVEYAVLHADGSSLLDSSTVVRARAAGVLEAPGRADVAALDAAVAQLSAGAGPGTTERLSALGVGAVQVPAGTDSELVTSLDLTPGLARSTQDGTLVWRVAGAPVEPAWAVLHEGLPATGETALRSVAADGRVVADRVGPGPDSRVLVLAETADPGWRATLDGRRLTAVEADGRQAFEVGPDGGRLVVEHDVPSRTPWLVLAGLVLVVFVLLALPVARRRSR
ncbi:hypothetical protein GCM10023216_07030 [Isoptericola chiayiensis]|uniref:Glycosyl transferase family 2 n=1 Tax=Isoptericola chiayiensis TaxID=579446 RepID=A0ABP8Y4U5_9MICO|nr:glycosyltransferase [Isoptericola chiayiensis]NOV99337.1 GT2 family glycosyltransferase [Isoptericola chiayiensis]